MALLDTRALPIDLPNVRSDTGSSLREQRQHMQRLAEHSEKLHCFLEKAKKVSTTRANFCLDGSQHGAPQNFNIVETRQRQRGEYVCDRSAFARALHEEKEFERLVLQQTPEERVANVRHARRAQRAVVGTNFVPDTVDDLPECERRAVLRSRLNAVDRLHYEIRNTDRMRDTWRLNKERAGHIIAPPSGIVGI